MLNQAMLACGLLLVAAAAAPLAQADEFSSPMVKREIYRDGAVQRSVKQFGHWTMVCDEIEAMKRRFCSLRSAMGPVGHSQASADVSTGDDGRPAVLIHLPVAISIAFGLQTVALGDGATSRSKRASKPSRNGERHVSIAACTKRECLALWSLDGAELDALSSGNGISLTFCTVRQQNLEFASDLRTESCGGKTAGLISSIGFNDAVRASLD